MIQVRAPSRLHFGLLRVPSQESGTDVAGHHPLPMRRFGSAGMMVEAPGIELTAVASSEWAAEGPLSERVLRYARQFISGVPPHVVHPMRLVIEQAAPEHSGLGTGTQLGMAVAGALAHAYGLSGMPAVELAERVGRGARSALGIHGFAQGGFLVEAGKGAETAIAPLVARVHFPEVWRLVVVIGSLKSRHGSDEQDAFQALEQLRCRLETTDALCRLVLLGMLPALVEADFQAFSHALFEFNARAGELFAPIQGGCYSHPRIADMVDFIRGHGIEGVGQSSWGPSVFAVCPDSASARTLVWRIRDQYRLSPQECFVTCPRNHGATVKEIQSS